MRISNNVQRKICDCSFCNSARDGRVVPLVTLNEIMQLLAAKKIFFFPFDDNAIKLMDETNAFQKEKTNSRTNDTQIVVINGGSNDISVKGRTTNRQNKICAT